MREYPDNRTFVASSAKPVDVVKVLKSSGAEIALNYLPVGSAEATIYYAECCLEAGVSLINCIPVFIASDPVWAKRFADKGIPLVGDDVKSQVGATIVHRTLAKLFEDRGAKIDRTYQLNTGGNTDFLNMLNRTRLKFKKFPKPNPSNPSLRNAFHLKIFTSARATMCHGKMIIKSLLSEIEGRGFANVALNLEVRLSVEDSPNSAGVAVDAIRCSQNRPARERSKDRSTPCPPI